MSEKWHYYYGTSLLFRIYSAHLTWNANQMWRPKRPWFPHTHHHFRKCNIPRVRRQRLRGRIDDRLLHDLHRLGIVEAFAPLGHRIVLRQQPLAVQLPVVHRPFDGVLGQDVWARVCAEWDQQHEHDVTARCGECAKSSPILRQWWRHTHNPTCGGW